jgi:hypothetical protein
MQRLFVVTHGTLGSYLCDAFHEGGATVVACLPAPRAYTTYLFSFPLIILFAGGLIHWRT